MKSVEDDSDFTFSCALGFGTMCLRSVAVY